MNNFTLRKKIEEEKAWCLQHFGKLDWRWTDEALPWTIMEYHGGIGSTADFTEDDWQAAEENGFSRAEVIDLCREDEGE